MPLTEGPAPRRPPLRPAFALFLRGYRASDLRGDAVSGIVVALVAITLSVPFAMASLGQSDAPTAGLVSVVVGGGIAALLGGSRVLVTGPTSGFIVVVAGIVGRHGFEALLAATLMAGLVLVLAGVLRLGRVLRLVPYPVTVGFTAGLAIAIFLGQWPDLLGVTLDGNPADPLVRAGAAVASVAEGAWSPWALAIAAGTVALCAIAGRLVPRVPSLVTGLVGATLLVHVLGLPAVELGQRFAIPHGLPAPSLPTLAPSALLALVPDALTLAFLAAVQTGLTGVVADGMTRTRHDPDQELVGQGMANLAAPLFGGLPVAGAVARTATGIQNGARTPVAALVHALVVLGALLLAPQALAVLPIPVLAGVLAVVAWTMAQRSHLRRLLRMPRADAGVLVATLVLTVAVGLSTAIAVGMVLATALFLRELGHATRVGPWRNAPDDAAPGFTDADIPPGVVVYSIDGPLFFGAVDQFRDALARIGRKPRAVVLRMRDVPYLDSTALNVLVTAAQELRRQGTRVVLSGIRAQPLQALEEAGEVHAFGEGNLFRTTADALAELRAAEARGA